MKDEDLREIYRSADAGDVSARLRARMHHEREGVPMPHRFFSVGDVVSQRSCSLDLGLGPWRCRVDAVNSSGRPPTTTGLPNRVDYTGCHKDEIVLLERAEVIADEFAELARREAAGDEESGMTLRSRRYEVGTCVACGTRPMGDADGLCIPCDAAWAARAADLRAKNDELAGLLIPGYSSVAPETP